MAITGLPALMAQLNPMAQMARSSAVGQQQQQPGNLLNLLQNVPQVPVPQQMQGQSPFQAGLMGVLSMINPQLAQQKQQSMRQQLLQNQRMRQDALRANIEMQYDALEPLSSEERERTVTVETDETVDVGELAARIQAQAART